MWRAVYSQSRQELRAVVELQHVGIEAFCPFERITEFRTVSRKRGTSRKVSYDRPIFSRYLFADCDDMPALKQVHLVHGVVANDDGMLAIPVHGRFAELLDLARGGEPLTKMDLTRLSMGFAGRVNDLFTFIGSGFEGHRGKILSLDRLDSHGEVLVGFKMFGSERELPVPHTSIGSIVSDGRPRADVAA